MKKLIFIAFVLFCFSSQAQNWLLGGQTSTINDTLGFSSNKAIDVITNNVARVRIAANGNIGIGTTSPSSNLNVIGECRFGSASRYAKFESDGDLQFVGAGATYFTAANRYVYQYWASGQPQGEGMYFNIDGSNSCFEFRNGDSTAVVAIFHTNGRTIIGDSTQNANGHDDALLTIKGKAVAREMVCTSANWADYVFEPGYCLRSLPEVRTFIKNNGHLPDVPKAETVLKNGNNLAETDAILLRKIEEQTLYILELEERICRLEATNSGRKQQQEAAEAEKSKLEALEKRIELLELNTFPLTAQNR